MTSRLRSDQRHGLEVLCVAARVAGQDATAEHGSVGVDEEIREHVGLLAAVPAVFDVGAAGEEQRGAGISATAICIPSSVSSRAVTDSNASDSSE